MSGELKSGDLVFVYRSICGCAKSKEFIGKIFQIERRRVGNNMLCTFCRALIGRYDAEGWTEEGTGNLYPTAELKKIPPLSELETETTQERILA
jgi:hypothetical protein